MYLVIYEGIEKRRLLEIYCHAYYRVVEPHLYGCDHKGRDVLRAYQVAGCDGVGRHIGWKSYRIDSIEHIASLSTHFHGPRHTFHADRLKMQRVYCQIKEANPPAAHQQRAHEPSPPR